MTSLIKAAFVYTTLGIYYARGQDIHEHYDRMRHDVKFSSLNRSGIVDVITDEITGDELAFCHLVGLLGFTTENGSLPLGKDPYMGLVGLLLAVSHFNFGNGAIVKELAGINQRCNVRFTTEFIDSESNIFTSLETLTLLITRKHDKLKPCMILGAQRSSVTGPTSQLSSVHGYPQMSFTSSSPNLDLKRNYPLFSRIITPDKTAAKLAVKYLVEKNKAGHCAVLYVDDDFGNAYQIAFQSEAALMNLTIESYSFPVKATVQSIEEALSGIQKKGYKYIFALLHGVDHYEKVMRQAHKQDIVGPEFSWLFGADISSIISEAVYPLNSPLAIATQGIGMLMENAGRPGTRTYDAMVEYWSKLSDNDTAFFNSKVPLTSDANNVEFFKPDIGSGFFQNNDIHRSALFAYDTVVTLGLAACDAISDNSYLNGTTLTRSILEKTDFEGISGDIKIDPGTSSRLSGSTTYIIDNAQVTPVDRDGNVRFTVSESILFSYATLFDENQEGWKMKEFSPFIFADGTPVPPLDLPFLKEEKSHIGYLRYVGYALSGIIVVFSIICVSWTLVFFKDHAVQASHPLFLITLCIGTLVAGLSIVPMAIDDEIVSSDTLDISCNSIPWLFSMGIAIALSALIGKLRRINTLFREQDTSSGIKLYTSDIIVPLLFLLLLNTAVLATLTFLFPTKFVRHPVGGTDEYDRVLRSEGTCVIQHRWAETVVHVVNVIALIYVNMVCIMLRNVETEYKEMHYIWVTVGSLLQAVFIGTPFVLLAANEPRTKFLARSVMAFVLCMAILIFIFVPKIINRNEEATADFTNRVHTSLGFTIRKEATNESQTRGNVYTSSASTHETGTRTR